MKNKYNKYIQNLYRKRLQEKKELERDFVIILLLLLFIGVVIIIGNYIGDP
ncbi:MULTISPECIES: hypothetical protein [Rummeliibacillus]|uniref:hypothetical protein n=1 Tax=Rummeliibacillus TaxID=648802 RepID=UPI001646FAFD|nr:MULTISPECIES: hypothetical protein [Rummeliibacillus]MBO2535827.1 hypothetical protein [Rummeliibacillus suwonensis]